MLASLWKTSPIHDSAGGTRAKPTEVSLYPRQIIPTLTAVSLTLILLSIAGQLIVYLIGYSNTSKLVRLTYVDAERNIPTAFSTMLLILSSLLSALVGYCRWKQSAKFAFHWSVLSLGFLTMAIDEAWSFHESLIVPMRAVLGGGDLGVFYFAWVVPGIALVLILAMFFCRFLLHLPAKFRIALFASAIVYLGGAIGMELVGGWFAELHGMSNLAYSMIVTLEEALEMIGLIAFLWALLVYIADECPDLQIRFARHDDA